jgi:hypothetical protein
MTAVVPSVWHECGTLLGIPDDRWTTSSRKRLSTPGTGAPAATVGEMSVVPTSFEAVLDRALPQLKGLHVHLPRQTSR